MMKNALLSTFLVLSAAACVATALPAMAATPVTYTFTGKVTAAHTSTGGVKAGQQVPISITLDRDYAVNGKSQYPQHEAVYYGGACDFANGASPILAITVNGVDAHGCYDQVRVQHDLNGASALYITSSTPQSGAGLILTLQTTISGTVKSLHIPWRVDAEHFKVRTFSTTQNIANSFSGAVMK